MNSLSTLSQLLKRDIVRIKREFLGTLFDSSFLLFCMLVVFGYLMSSYGLGESYGPFLLVSAIASFGFFSTVGKVFNLVTDIEGDRLISYSLTLPLPSWLVFVYIGLFWALESLVTTIFLFPIGKLILFNQFDLSQISYLKLVPFYISINIFYGFFSLWLSSILKNMHDLGKLWVRVINPLVMFGSFYNSWNAAYQAAPTVALIELINPVLYVMEGMRNATLGLPSAIPFWVCLCAIWCFTLICGFLAIKKLQTRLDCVR